MRAFFVEAMVVVPGKCEARDKQQMTCNSLVLIQFCGDAQRSVLSLKLLY